MKNLSRENFGAMVKRLRLEVCMEQEVVARVLDIPRSAVAAIESGSRDCSIFEFVELCKLFRQSPNDLLLWNKYKTRKVPNEK